MPAPAAGMNAMEETPTPVEPKPARRISRRGLLYIAAGAVVAVVVALVSGIPFGATTSESPETPAAPAETNAVFPPVIEAEARKHESDEPTAPAQAVAHGEPAAAITTQAKARVALPEVAATATEKSWATQFAAALRLEANREGDEAARRLRALVASLPAEITTVRRIVLLTLAAVERRQGRGAAADSVLAEAERASTELDGAELLRFARECLAVGAPAAARRVLARFSLASSECADGDLAGLITVCRLQAEACEAEWRRVSSPVPLPEALPTFLGARK